MTQSPLFAAAYEGDVEKFRRVLSNGPCQITHIDEDGFRYTVLHAAVLGGNKTLIREIIDINREFVHTTDKENQTPLHLAIQNNDNAALEVLVSAGANVNSMKSPQTKTPLAMAVEYPNLIAVQILINAGADVNVRVANGKTALHMVNVWQQTDMQVIDALIAAGADINATTDTGDRLIHFCARENRTLAVKHVIALGAKTDCANNDGHTPLHLAVQSANIYTIKLLLEAGADVNVMSKRKHTPLIDAIVHDWENESNPEDTLMNSCDIVSVLLNAGADPFIKDGSNYKPIELCRNDELVDILISYEEDINNVLKNYDYGTLLHGRAMMRNWLNPEILIKHGIDIDRKNSKGKTALHVAIENSVTKIVQVLLEQHCQINVKDKFGTTPMQIAVRRGYLPICEMLLEVDKKLLKTCDKFGNTLLHIAAEISTEMVEFLLKSGLDIEARNSEGRTPLHVAAFSDSHQMRNYKYKLFQVPDTTVFRNHDQIVQVLLDYGADMNVQDNYRLSPLDLATKSGNHLVESRLKGLDMDHETDTLLCDEFADTTIKNEPFNPASHDKTISLASAIAAGDTRKVQNIISNMPNHKDIKFDLGKSSLHFAIEKKQKDVLRILLRAGCDPNVVDSAGKTPLHLAAELEYLDGVQMLLDSGANINLKDKLGYTPFHTLAVSECDNSSVIVREEIYEAMFPKAELDSKTTDGKTVLHLAVEAKCGLEMRLLLDRKESLAHMVDSSGNTALHLAAAAGDPDNMKIILEYNVNVNAVNCFLATPLHLAVGKIENLYEINVTNPYIPPLCNREYFFNGCVVLLVSEGAMLNVRDRTGRTPLDIAKASHNYLIVKTLTLLSGTEKGNSRRHSRASGFKRFWKSYF